MDTQLEVEQLRREWDSESRWENIARGYTSDDVVRLRGTVLVEHTLARLGAEKFWKLAECPRMYWRC